VEGFFFFFLNKKKKKEKKKKKSLKNGKGREEGKEKGAKVQRHPEKNQNKIRE